MLFARIKRIINNEVVVNIFWLFFDKAYGALLTLVFLSLLAKTLGPDLFGIWNYIVAFGALIPAFGSLGLNFVIVKNLKKHPGLHFNILSNALALRFSVSTFFSVLLLAIYYGLDVNRPYTLVAGLVFVSQIFFVGNIFIFENEADLKNKKTVVARNIAFSLGFFLRYIGIVKKYDIAYFALINSIEFVAFFVLSALMSKSAKILYKSGTNRLISGSLVRQGLPLFMSAVTVILYLKIDQLIIGYFLNNESVGIYSAASRIAEMFYALPVIVSNVFFPKIVEHLNYRHKMDRFLSKMYAMVIIGTILLALVLSLFSKDIIQQLYGVEFLDSSSVLKIYAWSLVFMGLLVTSSKYLLAINKSNIILKRELAGLASNVVLNLILIPKFGVVGAAWATLISYSISSYFSNVFFKELRPLMKKQLLSVYYIMSK